MGGKALGINCYGSQSVPLHSYRAGTLTQFGVGVNIFLIMSRWRDETRSLRYVLDKCFLFTRKYFDALLLDLMYLGVLERLRRVVRRHVRPLVLLQVQFVLVRIRSLVV